MLCPVMTRCLEVSAEIVRLPFDGVFSPMPVPASEWRTLADDMHMELKMFNTYKIF